MLMKEKSPSLILKNSENSVLDDSCIFLPSFPPRTNLALHNISVTPKVIKKSHNEFWFFKVVMSPLYSSDGSKNYEPKLPYILAQ